MAAGASARLSAYTIRGAIMRFYTKESLYPQGLYNELPCVMEWGLKQALALQRLVARMKHYYNLFFKCMIFYDPWECFPSAQYAQGIANKAVDDALQSIQNEKDAGSQGQSCGNGVAFEDQTLQGFLFPKHHPCWNEQLFLHITLVWCDKSFLCLVVRFVSN